MISDYFVICGIPIVIIVILVIITAFFISTNKQREKARREQITGHMADWGQEICDALINRKIQLDMISEMVRLAWGSPTTIDNKEISTSGQKERWVYGTPRKDARYVWFANDKVTKIKS
jgi:hypothetical protein